MKHVVLAILCAIGTVQPLCAAEPARFAVQLLGVRIGQLEMSGRAGGGAYAARARFRTTGAAGLLARVRFDLAARKSVELDGEIRSRAEALFAGQPEA